MASFRPQPSPRHFRAAIAFLAALTLGTYSGCTCRHGSSDADEKRDFGDLAGYASSATSVRDARAYLAMARAIVENKGRSTAPAPPEAKGRRVMLTLWHEGQATVATANAGTLADAVANAAEAIARRGPRRDGRLELDVPTNARATSLDEDTDAPWSSGGLEGVFVMRDDGRTAFVLPGEFAQRGMLRKGKVNRAALARLLATRSEVPEDQLAAMRTYRFQADVHVESPDHRDALPVVRGMVATTGAVTPEILLAAVRRGADYLARIIGPSGRYVYMYHPVEDRDDTSYGWLRHSGTTYALFEAYEAFGTASYLEKGESALRYLDAHLLDDAASQGKYVVDTDDEEQQKVGGAALALLAFAKHGKTGALETMRALARFIIKQQYPDGHFRANADVERETGKRLKREPVYYPGEAVLALMRLYAVDPQPSYLDAARKGADFVVHVRDAYVSEENQEHDHWISYAFNELYRVTRDDAYLAHAFKIARSIERKQHRAAAGLPADLVGTFYDGQTTPAATRVEAYDSDILLSRFAAKPEAWLRELAEETAGSILRQQYRPDNDYWLKNPAKAEGGVRESPFVHDVRIDCVQHAMSAWLHLARIMADPTYGTGGLPGQPPAVERSALH